MRPILRDGPSGLLRMRWSIVENALPGLRRRIAVLHEAITSGERLRSHPPKDFLILRSA
jgi:hypothetical protein